LGRGEVYTEFGWGNLRQTDHLEDPGADGRITLRRIFRKWVEWTWPGLIGSGQRQVAVTCKCGNDPSGSIKCGEFLDWLRIC
jgi:hypothetical protein